MRMRWKMKIIQKWHTELHSEALLRQEREKEKTHTHTRYEMRVKEMNERVYVKHAINLFTHLNCGKLCIYFIFFSLEKKKHIANTSIYFLSWEPFGLCAHAPILNIFQRTHHRIFVYKWHQFFSKSKKLKTPHGFGVCISDLQHSIKIQSWAFHFHFIKSL